jgi:hypothetical protein
MRDSHALIQHMNPACRVARLFPELPIARLLISLNDYDVPYFDLQDRYNANVTRLVYSDHIILRSLQLLSALPSRCLTVYSTFPASVQDTIVDILGTTVLNLAAIAL